MADPGCDVTVVIATRNRAGLLAGAMRCALDQVGVALELKVVDDGSEDGTAEFVRGLAEERVELLRNDSPRGVAAARNRALTTARGEWVAFLDDDDLWAPTWLSAALAAGRRAGAGIVYGSRWVIDRQRRVRAAMLAEHPSAVHGMLASRNSLGGPSAVVVRADVLAQVGGFDERLAALADWDLWLRVLERCSAAAVPEPLVGYTIYDDNMHVRAPFAVLAEFDRFREMIAARGGPIDALREPEFISWLAIEAALAGRRLAAARLWLEVAWRLQAPRPVIRAGRALASDRRRPTVAYAAPVWLEAFAAYDPSPAALSARTSR